MVFSYAQARTKEVCRQSGARAARRAGEINLPYSIAPSGTILLKDAENADYAICTKCRIMSKKEEGSRGMMWKIVESYPQIKEAEKG